ncbi:MAG: hypothetical protein ACRD47_16400, partial [Nitrososphaeraceae archaeon]
MIGKTRVRKGTSKTITAKRPRTQPPIKEADDDDYDLPITMKETRRSGSPLFYGDGIGYLQGDTH